jgi:N-acetylneuraminate synthase/N,N'-diacetyllegionaminate synthase
MVMDNDKIYIIAEIGGNHEGDFEKARSLMKQAIDSGADSVKFQVYSGHSLVNIKKDPDRVHHFNRFALKDEEYVALAKECRELGADFNASIWNEEHVQLLDEYLTFYKIGSGDLTAYPLLKVIIKKRKPIVLSTGLSTLNEIDETVEYICRIDSLYRQRDMLSLLQCTCMYPIPDSDANLRVINTLQDRYSYNIGYSDHTLGGTAVEVAVALGAKIIEVHFTDSREGKEFRDHKVSFTPDEVKQIRKKVNTINTLLGDGIKRPMESEIESGHVLSFRRGLYPKRNITVGERIQDDDFIALRPQHGIPANQLGLITGKVANRNIEELSTITIDDFS